ncbi:MAG TPA: glyceraldehyde-3-phosphate dehydrogenase, partial [Spirochaetales bacterium]|nr:glyceraldehyde-3-phosphate dehydrogenase [Spirochaetales bacterium]
TIVIDEERQGIVVNGNFIQFIFADKPEDVDYAQYGISNAIVVDNTGVWRDQAGLSRHLSCKGAQRVLLTAPGKGAIKNIVFGVNHEVIEDADTIVSAASCTTNAIVPVLKLVSEQWGIVRGHVETVHSYTNDQNLIDNFHKAERRGRAAALNMVITETGAAKAAAKALPELAGKLTANAIRVPTANVSIAILNLQLERETSVQELNEYIFKMSLYSPLQKQIDFIDSAEVASSDFVGNRHASVYDAKATIVDGKNVVLYVWYDNEYGYSCQVVRILQEMSNISFQVFPKDR